MEDELQGRHILVVEDEALIALMLEDLLEEIGCKVVATAARPAQALRALDEETVEAAILDVNLDGRDSFGVAGVLAERNIPFLFATGYGGRKVKDSFEDRPVIGKPYSKDEVRAALQAALAGR